MRKMNDKNILMTTKMTMMTMMMTKMLMMLMTANEMQKNKAKYWVRVKEAREFDCLIWGIWSLEEEVCVRRRSEYMHDGDQRMWEWGKKKRFGILDETWEAIWRTKKHQSIRATWSCLGDWTLQKYGELRKRWHSMIMQVEMLMILMNDLLSR